MQHARQATGGTTLSNDYAGDDDYDGRINGRKYSISLANRYTMPPTSRIIFHSLVAARGPKAVGRIAEPCRHLFVHSLPSCSPDRRKDRLDKE